MAHRKSFEIGGSTVHDGDYIEMPPNGWYRVVANDAGGWALDPATTGEVAAAAQAGQHLAPDDQPQFMAAYRKM